MPSCTLAHTLAHTLAQTWLGQFEMMLSRSRRGRSAAAGDDELYQLFEHRALGTSGEVGEHRPGACRIVARKAESLGDGRAATHPLYHLPHLLLVLLRSHEQISYTFNTAVLLVL